MIWKKEKMQAGLLRVKLKHYDELINNRKHIVNEYLGKKRGAFPIKEKLCEEIVSLPMMDYMNEKEIDLVIDAVNHY